MKIESGDTLFNPRTGFVVKIEEFVEGEVLPDLPRIIGHEDAFCEDCQQYHDFPIYEEKK